MAKKSFLDDTKLFPDFETKVATEPPKEEAPETEPSKGGSAPAKKKAPITETEKEALKQYAYYDHPERHAKLKMWAITSKKRDEKDISSIIRKAVDEFFRRR